MGALNRSNGVTVLAYHRIDTPANPATSDLSPTLIDATPEAFEAQVRWVARNYHVISAWELVGALREGKRLPERALVITFDDGYLCYKDTALPILRKCGLPSTVFVPTAYATYPTQPFWWDTLHRVLHRSAKPEIEVPGVGFFPMNTGAERDAAYEALVAAVERTETDEVKALVERIAQACDVAPTCEKHIMGWDEIEELGEADDVTIGPHTRHHPILARCNGARIRGEVEGSWADLQKHMARPLPLFAYPNGQPYAVNQASREAVKRAGLVGAFTMVAGRNIVGSTDPLLLHRIGASAGHSLNRFKLSVSPLGGALRRVKGMLRTPTGFAS